MKAEREVKPPSIFRPLISLTVRGRSHARNRNAWRNPSTFLEYDHYDFGNKNVMTGTAETTIYALDIKPHVDVVKVGLNFRTN